MPRPLSLENIRQVPIQEILDVNVSIDLSIMASAEVIAAYIQLKVPCIVEHAGLILQNYFSLSRRPNQADVGHAREQLCRGDTLRWAARNCKGRHRLLRLQTK